MYKYNEKAEEVKKLLLEAGFELDENRDTNRDRIISISKKINPTAKEKLDKRSDQIQR